MKSSIYIKAEPRCYFIPTISGFGDCINVNVYAFCEAVYFQKTRFPAYAVT